MTHEMHITSKGDGKRYFAHVGGEQVYAGRTPHFGGARALLDRGASPDDLLTTYVLDTIVFRSTVGKLAAKTVIESDHDGPRLGRFKAFPGTTMADATDLAEIGAPVTTAIAIPEEV